MKLSRIILTLAIAMCLVACNSSQEESEDIKKNKTSNIPTEALVSFSEELQQNQPGVDMDSVYDQIVIPEADIELTEDDDKVKGTSNTRPFRQEDQLKAGSRNDKDREVVDAPELNENTISGNMGK